jgi:hypothetical protein
MNSDAFEQRLQRQSLRQVPSEWRGEILSAARAAIPRPSTLDSRPCPWWRELLWPCPQAWVGLAAVWVLILALNFMTRDEPKALAKQDLPPSSPQLLAVLEEQRRLFAELVGSPEIGDAVRPKPPVPKPRSERPDRMKAA